MGQPVMVVYCELITAGSPTRIPSTTVPAPRELRRRLCTLASRSGRPSLPAEVLARILTEPSPVGGLRELKLEDFADADRLARREHALPSFRRPATLL